MVTAGQTSNSKSIIKNKTALFRRAVCKYAVFRLEWDLILGEAGRLSWA